MSAPTAPPATAPITTALDGPDPEPGLCLTSRNNSPVGRANTRNGQGAESMPPRSTSNDGRSDLLPLSHESDCNST